MIRDIQNCNLKALSGNDNGNYIHGLTSHPLYTVWVSMKQRCYYDKSTRYKDWGGRGIKACSEWVNSPVRFITWAKGNGWTKGLQLDRKNNDEGYSPENCKFSTPKENSNNKSKQSNNTSGFVGVTKYSIDRLKHPWIAYVYINREKKHIGYFDSPYSAAIARDEYIKQHKLQHKLNFEEGGKGYEQTP